MLWEYSKGPSFSSLSSGSQLRMILFPRRLWKCLKTKLVVMNVVGACFYHLEVRD